MKSSEKDKKSVKDLLPRGWTTTLMERTNKSYAFVFKVVKEEKINSPIWPEVLKLAKENQDYIKRNSELTEELTSGKSNKLDKEEEEKQVKDLLKRQKIRTI